METFMFVVGVFLRKTFLSNIFPKGKFNFRSQLRHFLPDLENVENEKYYLRNYFYHTLHSGRPGGYIGHFFISTSECHDPVHLYLPTVQSAD